MHHLHINPYDLCHKLCVDQVRHQHICLHACHGGKFLHQKKKLWSATEKVFLSGKPTQNDKSPCLPEDCWPAETKGRKERSKAPVLQFSAKSANKKKEQLGGWEITYFATDVKSCSSRMARTDRQKRDWSRMWRYMWKKNEEKLDKMWARKEDECEKVAVTRGGGVSIYCRDCSAFARGLRCCALVHNHF